MVEMKNARSLYSQYDCFMYIKFHFEAFETHETIHNQTPLDQTILFTHVQSNCAEIKFQKWFSRIVSNAIKKYKYRFRMRNEAGSKSQSKACTFVAKNSSHRIKKVNNQTKIRSMLLKISRCLFQPFPSLALSRIACIEHDTTNTSKTTSIDLVLSDRHDTVSIRLSVKWEKPSIALVTILKVSISFWCSAIFFTSSRLHFLSSLPVH